MCEKLIEVMAEFDCDILHSFMSIERKVKGGEVDPLLNGMRANERSYPDASPWFLSWDDWIASLQTGAVLKNGAKQYKSVCCRAALENW